MKCLFIILALLPQILQAQDKYPGEKNPLTVTLPSPRDDSSKLSSPALDLATTPFLLDSTLSLSSSTSRLLDSLKKVQSITNKFKVKKLAIPATLITMGFVTMGTRPVIPMNLEIREEILEHHPGFSTDLDDYTRNVPMAMAYGLNLAGLKGKNGYFNLTGIFMLSNFINSAVTKKLKSTTHQPRPDYSSFDAFPSGHTSQAFAQATVLFLEYKDQSIWYGISGYGFATATGALRLYNNKHWISDVIAGAGVGIISAQVAYLVYPWLLKKVYQEFPRLGAKQRLLLTPMYANGNPGLGLVVVLK